MCGFIHSTRLIVPVKVIGLFGSNSAVIAWWATRGATPKSHVAMTETLTNRFRPIAASYLTSKTSHDGLVLVLVFGNFPDLDRAVEERLKIVLLARVLQDPARARGCPPSAYVHPIPHVGLGIVHRDRVLHRARVGPRERIDHLQFFAEGVPTRVQPCVAVETGGLD